VSPRPTLADWRQRALDAEAKLAAGPREDIASGNVWPDASDPAYVEWLDQRVRDLEGQLAKAEELLGRYEAWGSSAMSSLDDVVARLIIEEHGPPPQRPRTS
jgi:hypothetical protein